MPEMEDFFEQQTSVVLRTIQVFLGMIVIFLMVWILIIGKTIILPFMIALFLSFILDPIVSFLTRWKIPLSVAVLITLLFSSVILYLLGLLVYANAEMFVGQFPTYQVRMMESLNKLGTTFESWFGTPLDIAVWKDFDWLGTFRNYSIAKTVVESLGTFVTFVLKMLIVVILIAYFLTGKRNLNKKIFVAFPDKRAKQVVGIIDNITHQIQKYLGAKTLISLLTGVISIVIFYIFGLDFAVFWGFIIFLFNFIPNIGSTAASVLPVLFSLLQFGSLGGAFWLGVSLVILQLSMGNIIEPRLMGYSLNLSPLIVILSLVFWGYIWGVAGMILAVPILGTMAIIFENIKSLNFLSVFIRGKAK